MTCQLVAELSSPNQKDLRVSLYLRIMVSACTEVNMKVLSS